MVVSITWLTLRKKDFVNFLRFFQELDIFYKLYEMY